MKGNEKWIENQKFYRFFCFYWFNMTTLQTHEFDEQKRTTKRRRPNRRKRNQSDMEIWGGGGGYLFIIIIIIYSFCFIFVFYYDQDYRFDRLIYTK
jgi:hypothetical protein